MNQGTVGYAIIGCGMIARFHIAAIQEIENARLVGVFDQQQINANRIAAEFQVKAYESMPELWEDTQVDAVCICTPSGLHATLALEALSHGKHVLIEKPMALNEQDCDAIICAAKETQRLAGVVSQMRFSPDVCRVKEALDQGLIGKLISVDLIMKYFRDPSYYQNSTWRGTKKMDGGGALMNQGIHGVDLMQYLAGMPSMVISNLFCNSMGSGKTPVGMWERGTVSGPRSPPSCRPCAGSCWPHRRPSRHRSCRRSPNRPCR